MTLLETLLEQAMLGPVSASKTAVTTIDYRAESTVGSIYSLSGSATDLFVGYAPTFEYPLGEVGGASGPLKIEKIPLSGNLSWASGSDVADFGNDNYAATTPKGKLVVEDSEGNIQIDGSTYVGQAFYGMDGSDHTFLSANSSHGMYQWKMGEIIGSSTARKVGPRVGLVGADADLDLDLNSSVTYYQRIK